MRIRRILTVGTVFVALANAGSVAVATADTLQAGGDSWPTPAVAKLQNDSASTVAPFDQKYTDLTEAGGKDDLASGNGDYAVVESPLTDAQKQTAAGANRTIAYAPYMSGAVTAVVALDIDPSHGGGRITHLSLTVPTLAKVFTERIANWSDPEIVAENPDQPDLANVFNKSVEFAALKTSSSSTAALISLFLSDPGARKIWNDYASALSAPTDTPLDEWPEDDNSSAHLHTDGSKGLIDFMLGIDPQTGQRFPGAVSHYIGYLAPAWADKCGGDCQDQVPTVTLLSSDMQKKLDPTVDAVSKAVAAGQTDPQTNIVTLNPGHKSADELIAGGIYPMPLVSYLAVPTTGLDPGKTGAVAKFVQFAVGDAGQKDVTDFKYVAATADMKAASTKVATAMSGQAATTTTTAPTTAISAPADSAGAGGSAADAGASGGADVAGSSAGPASGTDAAALPNTGGSLSWPLAVVAGVLLLGGEAVRRRRTARLHRSFTE